MTQQPASASAASVGLPLTLPRFSQELKILTAESENRPPQLSELLAATRGRGFDLLLLCVALPFITPVPLPGLSAPFGIIVALIGAHKAVGRNPRLPRRLLTTKLPPRFLRNALKATSRIVGLLEVLLKPRLPILYEAAALRQIAGLLIMLSGLLLLLPLPLPFCNSLPALTVVLLAAGALERDGIAFLAGCLTFALTATYFGLLAFGGAHAFERFLRFY